MEAAEILGFQCVYWFLQNFLLVVKLVVLYKPKFRANTAINFLNPIDNNIYLYSDCSLRGGLGSEILNLAPFWCHFSAIFRKIALKWHQNGAKFKISDPRPPLKLQSEYK